MGATTRRTPISSKIPDDPDYEFLNILDFGGISQSDNPFTVDSSSCSDSLNVYVDKDNALTTRPRVEEDVDLSDITGLPTGFEFINVYPLSDGYLIHGKVVSGSTTTYYLYHYNDTLLSISIGTALQNSNKFLVFEQDDNIYILDGTKYYFINSSNTFAEVYNEYIPTTTVKKTTLADGSDFESLNLLSNKYKEEYVWDGSSNLNVTSNRSGVIVESPYKTVFTDKSGDYDNWRIFTIDTDTKSCWGLEPTDSANQKKLNYLTFSDNYTEITSKILHSDLVNSTLLYACNKTFFIAATAITRTDSSTISCTFKHYYVEDNAINTNTQTITYTLPAETGISYNLVLRPIGDKFCMIITKTETSTSTFRDRYLYVYKMISGNGYTLSELSQSYSIGGISSDYFLSGDDSYLVLITSELVDSTYTAKMYRGIESEEVSDVIDWTEMTNLRKSPMNFTISTYFGYSAGYIFHFGETLENVNEFLIADIRKTNVSDITFSEYDCSELGIKNGRGLHIDTNRTYALSLRQRHDQWLLWYTTDLTTWKGWYSLNIPISDVLSDEQTNWSINIENFKLSGMIQFLSNKKTTIKMYDSEYPLIVEYELNDNDEDYDNWLERRNKLLTSNIMTRFDNNRWFGSDNHLFWTAYNNPAYVPMTNYDKVGDINYSLTGFNNVSDSLLTAYTPNQLVLIAPTTINDVDTYAVTETKNTQGNIALGNSISTIYSELPVQINRDGIFSLNQVDNIATSDNICKCISDNIAKKWFAEDKSIIEKCLTVNYRYWTLFTLPKTDKSSIYLLDNRNLDWFYWEIPIVVKNIFNKDDEVKFTDADGQVYHFTTDDINTTSGGSIIRTDYYDVGNQIIDWHWYSQILPLGTINYSKKLIQTTFIINDSDASDNYGFNYQFRAFKKEMTESSEKTIDGDLNYVRSTTVRTKIPRVNFIQLRLSNVPESTDYNKLRLTGIGFRYELLEVV